MNSLNLRISEPFDRNFKLASSHLYKPVTLQLNSNYGCISQIELFIKEQSVESQISCLKNIECILKKPNIDVNDEVKVLIRFLIHVYLESPLKHPVRNCCCRIVASLRNLATEFQQYFNYQMKCMLNNSEISVAGINKMCSVINGCFDNFTLGIPGVSSCIRESLDFLQNSLNYFKGLLSEPDFSPTDRLEQYTLIHNIMRAVISIMQKCNPSSKTVQQNYSNDVLNYFLNHPDLPMDTRGNCALIMLLIANLQEGQFLWIKFVADPLDVAGLSIGSDSAKICILSAVINTVKPSDLENIELDEINAVLLIVNKLMEISGRSSVEPVVVLAVARTMLNVSRLLFKMSDNVVIYRIVEEIMEFEWLHLEHSMDSVRHLSQQTMTNLVKLSNKIKEKGDEKLFDGILQSIKCIPLDRRSRYIALACVASETSIEEVFIKVPGLVEPLLNSLNNLSISSDVLALLKVLLNGHAKNGQPEAVFQTWIKPILEKLSKTGQNEDGFNDLSVLENLLQLAIKLFPSLIHLIMFETMQESDLHYGKLKCTLVCLKAARMSGVLDCEHTNDKWKNVISFNILNSSVIYAASDIRLLALSLIVETSKSTEPFCHSELGVIQNFLRCNLNTQSSNFRQNMLSLLKKMLKRWEDSFTKNSNYIEYVTDLRKVFTICRDNIILGGNFSRRHCSLQMISWIATITSNLKFDCDWRDMLLPLISQLSDSYDVNKLLALNIIKTVSSSSAIEHSQARKEVTFYSDHQYGPLLFLNADEMNIYLEKTFELASSVKPSDCSCAAYRLHLLIYFPHILSFAQSSTFKTSIDVIQFLVKRLLDNLKCDLKIAKENLLVAAGSCPMYGVLYCIRHLLGLIDFKDLPSGDWSDLLDNIIITAMTVSQVVAPIVNSSSPEGHLPMDFNDGSKHLEGNYLILANDITVSAQMLLLCSWRSVKEVSLLLGEISSKAAIDGRHGSITEDHILSIGKHFTTLLSETKHRGAFEQAYVGFSKLCSRLWASRESGLHSLPRKWLDSMMSAIHGDTDEHSRMCATRRSAGIPFMVQALVTTEIVVSGNPQCFNECMATLLKLAKSDELSCTSVETRTHCLNILRALYRNTTLGEVVNPHVCDGIITAISGFDRSTWAERNSSTLLFSSLITRVFGVQRSRDGDNLCIRNKMTGRIFFLLYPKLYDFMLNHLKSSRSGDDGSDLLKPSLYPVLLLLSRLYPSSLEGTESNLKLVAFIPFVSACAASRVLKTRQLAAKAFVPLISPDRYLDHVTDILTCLADETIKHNYCHGLLLQLKLLLKSKPNNLKVDQHREIIQDKLKQTCWIINRTHSETSCFVTAEEYISVLHLMITTLDFVIENYELWTKIDTHITASLNRSMQLTFWQFGMHTYLKKCIDLKITLTLLLNSTSDNSKLLTDVIIQYCTHNHYEVIISILNYVICIYHARQLDAVKDRFEISDSELNFVERLPIDMIRNISLLLQESQCFSNRVHSLTKQTVYTECRHRALFLSIFIKDGYKSLGNEDGNLVTDDLLLKTLIECSKNENDNISYVYIHYIKNLMNNTLVKQIYDHFERKTLVTLCNHLLDSCSAEKHFLKRQAVCDMLHTIFFHVSDKELNTFLRDQDECECIILVWTALLMLLEDHEESIRKNASNLVVDIENTLIPSHFKNTKIKHSVVESKAKELLVDNWKLWNISTNNRSSEDCHVMIELVILFWCFLDFRGEFEESSDVLFEGRVFDRGEMNTFREDHQLMRLCPRSVPHLTKEKLTNLLSAETRYREMFRRRCGIHYLLLAKELGCDKDYVAKRIQNNDYNSLKVVWYMTDIEKRYSFDKEVYPWYLSYRTNHMFS